MPVSGEIAAINEELDDDPSKVNSDPYGDGWLVKIKLSNPDEEGDLMSFTSYEEIIG
jgi:glycine cleavage system H protein